MSTLPALLVAAVMARKHPLRVVRVLPWFAVAGALGAGIFGMFTIKTGLTPIQGMADLWCALMSLVTIVITLVAARRVELEQNRQSCWRRADSRGDYSREWAQWAPRVAVWHHGGDHCCDRGVGGRPLPAVSFSTASCQGYARFSPLKL